jgi:AmiR/NasT family two-component response regulator
MPDSRPGQRRADRRPADAAAAFPVLVAVEPDDQGQFLVRELRRLRGEVTAIWPAPDRFPADAGVIVAAHEDRLVDRLPWVPGEASAALVVVLPQHEGYRLESVLAASPDGLLHRPFQGHQVRTVTLLAREQHLYLRRLRNRIERLEDTIRAARDIERAKSILMALRKVDEEEAYAILRNQAMKKRVSIAAVALSVIDSSDMLNLA